MEQDVSLRGRIIRQVIAGISSDFALGDKLKSGELRKNLTELPWHCPDGFSMQKEKLRHCDAYLLQPDHPGNTQIILQLHGGGYIAALRNAYFQWAVQYSKIAGLCRVLTLDYRIAPEHPYPAALEDATDAYQWLLQNGYAAKDIVVVGDSAGGGLAMALCMKLREKKIPLPFGLIAMSPWTDLTLSGESYSSNFTRDPLFGNSKNSMVFNRDYIGNNNPKNPYISPLFGDFHDFPPMLIQVGDLEMLLCDSLGVAQKAKEQGVSVHCTVYEGMFHVFQMAGRLLPESHRAWEEIEEYLSYLGFGR